MNNFFLLNESINVKDSAKFISGMLELVAINKNEHDNFQKHESIYGLDCMNFIYENMGGFDEKAIFIFIEQVLMPYASYISNQAIFDSLFPLDKNAFLGIDFSTTPISSTNQIQDSKSYHDYCVSALWEVDFRSFWGKRGELFPNLIFCPQVKNFIQLIGTSPYFNQIITKLKEFDNAVFNWKSGAFSYNEINSKYALNISPESKPTMSKFGNTRMFKMPNGGTNIFELHIKTGNLRFHFFPEDKSKSVFIGYIGPHLQTVTN